MKIQIGKGSCGIAAGANKISDYLEKCLAENNLSVEIAPTGCIGMCYLEPIVDVYDDSGEKQTYVSVNNDVVDKIVQNILKKEKGSQHVLSVEDARILNLQKRIALRQCGIINPDRIEEYIETGGYRAIERCIKEMTPEQVIEEIKVSGLAGRGGGGFPTWFKWQAARNSPGNEKYVICNADEGDPGAFMDRALIEGDPHAMIEGMLIAAYAMGSQEGIVYVRAEYPLAIIRLENAIQQALEKGYLGKNLFGTSFSFEMRIKAGAGAFVCGEETALIASLEGERGMPRLKPPFPAQKGFWQKPSNINNVETYANIPWIITNGGKAFASMGTENSKGTKIFALTGKIKNGGLVEIPMGQTIKEVVFGPGGGIKNDNQVKAVQMGGPSGGCIPADKLDTIIDYKALAATGAIMGSGGMVVMDENTCMVDMARFFLDFTCKESCGKCTHCRVGTKRMLEVLTRITNGQGEEGDIELLEDLAIQIKEGAMCGLGQTAPNPVLTTIKYFRNEYEDHVCNKKCTAKQCANLITFRIDEKACTGCTACSRKCPVNAIAGAVKEVHTIDQQTCAKCGKCKDVCRFEAVIIE